MPPLAGSAAIHAPPLLSSHISGHRSWSRSVKFRLSDPESRGESRNVTTHFRERKSSSDSTPRLRPKTPKNLTGGTLELPSSGSGGRVSSKCTMKISTISEGDCPLRPLDASPRRPRPHLRPSSHQGEDYMDRSPRAVHLERRGPDPGGHGRQRAHGAGPRAGRPVPGRPRGHPLRLVLHVPPRARPGVRRDRLGRACGAPRPRGRPARGRARSSPGPPEP